MLFLVFVSVFFQLNSEAATVCNLAFSNSNSSLLGYNQRPKELKIDLAAQGLSGTEQDFLNSALQNPNLEVFIQIAKISGLHDFIVVDRTQEGLEAPKRKAKKSEPIIRKITKPRLLKAGSAVVGLVVYSGLMYVWFKNGMLSDAIPQMSLATLPVGVVAGGGFYAFLRQASRAALQGEPNIVEISEAARIFVMKPQEADPNWVPANVDAILSREE